jgi:hypothetical protein
MFNFHAIKDMQIKIALRFHLTPVKMAIIKGNNNNKCWRGCGKIRTLYSADGNVSQYNQYGKQSGQKTRDRTAI